MRKFLIGLGAAGLSIFIFLRSRKRKEIPAPMSTIAARQATPASTPLVQNRSIYKDVMPPSKAISPLLSQQQIDIFNAGQAAGNSLIRMLPNGQMVY